MTRSRNLGQILVTPNGPHDAGDFGRHTPGTKTSGIQEALDHARSSHHDLYISGGAGTTYTLDSTLWVPWAQDFRVDGGVYTMHYHGLTGPAVVFDSSMSCRFTLGSIVSENSDGPVVWIRPQSQGPDGFHVVTTTLFEFAEIRGRGTGVLIDANVGGGILDNRVLVAAIADCDVGMHLSASGVFDNELHVTYAHRCGTHLRLGESESASPHRNRITFDSIDGEATTPSIGAEVHGSANLLTLSVRRVDAGGDIVFGPGAKDNLVIGVDLPNGVTDGATAPTNRVVRVGSTPLDVQTPSVPPSGERLMNRKGVPIEATILGPGSVSEWSMIDVAERVERIDSGLFAGQQILLDPGDAVELEYDRAPTWSWRALG